MASFRYKALSSDGASVNGVIDAIDEYTAVTRIREEYPVVTSISEVKKDGISGLLNKEVGGKKLDYKALAVMCSQFSIILSSGVPVDSCLKMIGEQTKDKKLRKMLLESSKDVAQGATMSNAFEKNCPQLPVMFLETLRAGELSGNLTHSFNTLQEYYEKSYKLNQKIKQALSYPLFVLVVAIVVLFVVMVVVMPTFTSVFQDIGGELPTLTVMLLSMTHFFEKWWILMLAGILVGVALFMVYTHTENGKIWWAKTTLKLPVFGKINTLQGATQFATSMAALTTAGLTVSESLKVTSKVLDNYVLQTAVRKMAEKVETGYSLGEVMKDSALFPSVLNEMTSVGEDTGELSKTLGTIGQYYTNEYNYAVNRAISKLEPTLLIIMALFAGFIVIALYLPMFTMYNYM